MERNDQLIVEVRQMAGEMLGALRSLAPIPEALKTHAAQLDHALGLLDTRLDQVERAHIKTEAAIATLALRLDDKLGNLEKHEARIKSLEDDRIRVKAWAALIAFLGSIAAFLAGKFCPK